MTHKILICGYGNIAKRHETNLKNLFKNADLLIWRHDENFNKIIDFKPTVALITNASPYHIDYALKCAELDCHLFIEKPLSDSPQSVNQLIQMTKNKNLKAMVGYNFRFDKTLQLIKQKLDEGFIGKLLSITAEVGQYLPNWRPTKDYRECVSAQKKLGGGALLELSHEIDTTLWMAGSVKAVSCFSDKVSDLEIDVEDCAEIILQFENGALGHIHVDMIRQKPRRFLQLVGSKASITWDGLTDEVKCDDDILIPASNKDRNLMYVDELRYFFDCIQNNGQPSPSLDEGLQVLHLIQAAKKSKGNKINL